jgi:hypothetical protein
MINRLSNSWELIKASSRVLMSDKELLIFPLVSSIGTLIVTLTFLIPMFLSGLAESIFSDVPGSQFIGFLVLFVFYLCQYFVIIFSNSALVGAATIRLNGGDPGIADGFRIAFSHLGSIFGYAVISATVGTVLRIIAERSSSLGRLVISLVGLAWNIATFLVVPVLVVEGIGPLDAIKRSAALLKKTWGEQIAGNVGLGLVFGLITIFLIFISIPLFILMISAEIYWLAILYGILLVFFLTAIGLIQGALNGIFTAAVYKYAMDGDSSTFFPPALIENAFLVKK